MLIARMGSVGSAMCRIRNTLRNTLKLQAFGSWVVEVYCFVQTVQFAECITQWHFRLLYLKYIILKSNGRISNLFNIVVVFIVNDRWTTFYHENEKLGIIVYNSLKKLYIFIFYFIFEVYHFITSRYIIHRLILLT